MAENCPTYPTQTYEPQIETNATIYYQDGENAEKVFIQSEAPVAATATAGAATSDTSLTKVTTESLTTAAGATYTLTLTNSTVTANSIVFASVANGTNTTGQAQILTVTPGAGTVTIVIKNVDSAAAFNGTLVVSVQVNN